MSVIDTGTLHGAARRGAIVLGLMMVAACGDTAPDPGTIVVNFSTNPGDQSPFVWGVSVDGASPHNVTSADTGKFVIEGVSAGDHHLIASSLPTICTTGSDDRSITVPANDTLRVTFSLKCARTTGDIAVLVSTTGADLDADGYQLTVNDVAKASVAAVPSVSVTVPKVAPGAYVVSLTGLAPNCALSASQTATVTAGNAASVSLAVVCQSLNGKVRVVANTTGSNPDPSGYLITVSGQTPAVVAPVSTTDFSVPPGAYTVTIGDLEANCSTATPTRSASPAQSQTVTVTFDVTCGAYPATTAGVAITDPAGDTLTQSNTTLPQYYDLLAANTRYGPGFMIVTVKVNRPITNGLGGVIDMDLDEKLTTGDSSWASYFGGPPEGVDAFAQFRTDKPGSFLSLYPYTTLSGIQVIAAGDSVQVFVPLDHLKDDGNMTMQISIGRIVSTSQGEFLIFSDFGPNAALIVTRAPPGPALAAGLVPERTAARLTRTGRGTGRVMPLGKPPR